MDFTFKCSSILEVAAAKKNQLKSLHQ